MGKKGSIIKITINNFVTYDNVVIYPGPNLNVIIGPNGTGKSTVVAAIILGLGGTPKTIGRGSKVAEYVRNNCTEARIDIELYGDNSDTFTITRVFNVSSQSTWYINNKHCSEQEVKKFIQKLNIQVGNLCQFLPQDRVQDFAKMNKKELLLNMQTAVGRQDLVDKHTQLINIQHEQEVLKKELDILNKKLEQAERDNSRLESRVQNFKERKICLEEVEHIKRKISWKKYNKLTREAMVVKKDLLKAGEIMDKHKKKIQPLEKQIQELNKQSAELQRKLNEANRIVKDSEKKIINRMEQVEHVQKNQREMYCEMRVKIKALEHTEKEICTMETKIDKLINDEQDIIKKHGDEEAIQEKLKEINDENAKYTRTIDQMDRKRVTVLNDLRKVEAEMMNLEGSLKEMENLKSKRLEILRRKDKDAYSAILWLRENKHMFQAEVYEPIIMELDVLNVEHSKYLENIIPMRDRVAFTCEDREDMNLLLRTVRDQMGLNINVLHSGPEHPSLSIYKPQIPIEHLQKYGLYAYVISLIKGPEAILKYLCRMYSLHNIPIGDDSTYKKSEKVPPEIKLFFSANHRFFNSISRYTGEKSTRISGISSDGTFSICIDQNSVNRVKRDLDIRRKQKDEIQMQCEKQESEKQQYLKQRSHLFEERRALMKVVESVKNIRDRLVVAKKSLKDFVENNPREEEIRTTYALKIKNLMTTYVKKHENLLAALSELNESIKKEAILHEEINIVRENVTILDNEGLTLRENYENSRRDYTKIETFYRKAQMDADEALNVAKKLSDGFTPDAKGFDKFREKYFSLPKGDDALQNMYDEIQTKINCMSTADEGEIKEYEIGLKTIAELEEKLKEKSPIIQDIKERRIKLFEEWITPLQDLVSKINKNFSDYFESMGCAGEVEISKEKGELSFSDYGLVIRVTYRDEDPLQELNRYVQSGGERAVATAVFMLSMQDLTAVPFRCVDEINQGMDPQNERRIFEILVTATSKPDTCQYFLITPKLIPSLNFGDGIKIHVVHNAQFLHSGNECNIDDILDRI